VVTHPRHTGAQHLETVVAALDDLPNVAVMQIQLIKQLLGYEGEDATRTGSRCVSVNGFSLHANTQIPAHRRDQLERFIRSTTRGAVALERLQEDASGDLVYTLLEAVV